jgi:Serine/threonine protein kinase
VEIPIFISGTRLGPKGRYIVNRHIGKGGSANAYRAVDSDGRLVVLKVPHSPSELSSQEVLEQNERNERERWIGKHVGSTWAAAVYDHFELYAGSNIIVQVMEYVEGQNLALMLHRRRTGREAELPQCMSLDWNINTLADILAGISDAHNKGISHNDAKPENIVIDMNGRPRVLDWGQAKYHSQDLPEEGAMVTESLPAEALKRRPTHETVPGRKGGTPGYMAPENRDSIPSKFPFGQDIFSLGVIAYEMITEGLHPFAYYYENPEYKAQRAANPDREPSVPRLVARRDENGVLELNEMGSIIFGHIAKARPPRFSDILPHPISSHLADLENVIRKAMAPLPEDRYLTAREFREDLLMVRPRAKFRDLAMQRETFAREYRAMNDEWRKLGDLEGDEEGPEAPRDHPEQDWNVKADGRVIPPGRWRPLHRPVEELRQKRERWERGVDRLLNDLAALTGGDLLRRDHDEVNGFLSPHPGVWKEAHRMIAELNFQLLNDQIDFHPRDVRDDYMNQIAQHDTATRLQPRPTLQISMEAKVPLPFTFRDIHGGQEIRDNLHFELSPFLREVDLSGTETGFFRQGTARWQGDIQGLSELKVPSGYHVLSVRHPEFTEFNIPLRIDFDNIRAWVEGAPLTFARDFDLVPTGEVGEGLVLIPEGDAWIGLNIFHHDIIPTYSFPERRIHIPTIAISRDPITMGEYWEFNNEVLRGLGHEEAEKLIPRILRSNPARTFAERVKAGFLAARNEDRGYQVFWNILDHGRKRPGQRYELQGITSIHDSSREALRDPNGDPIYREQPTNSITYQMAQSFVEARSRRDGRSYTLPPAYILEAVTRSFLPMSFPAGNILDPESYVSRQVFADKRMTYPQPVGTHPLGAGYDRDMTLFGTRGHLGNVREFSSTPGEKNTVAIFGGSIGVIPGPLYYPASRNWLGIDRPVPGVGAFRLMQQFLRGR